MSPKLQAGIIMGLVLGSVLSLVLLQFTSTESKLGILDDYNKLGDSFTQSSVSSVMQTINNPSVETTTQYVEQQEDPTEVTPTPTPEGWKPTDTPTPTPEATDTPTPTPEPVATDTPTPVPTDTPTPDPGTETNPGGDTKPEG